MEAPTHLPHPQQDFVAPPAARECLSLFMCDDSASDKGKEAVMDFVLSWTLRRAQSRYRREKSPLHAACRHILFGLLEIADYSAIEVEEVRTEKQWKNTDLVARVTLRLPGGQTQEHALLVENKVYTQTRPGQLPGYKQAFDAEYACGIEAPHRHYVLITCHSAPQPQTVAHCREAGFRYLPIEDLQPVAPEQDTESDLFNEFWLRNW